MEQSLQKCQTKRCCVKSSWVFIIFLILALGIWVTGVNHELFVIINSYHELLPDKFWEFFNLVSYSRFFILPVLLLLITVARKRQKLPNILLLIIAYYLIFAVLKKLVGEARPYIVLPADSFFWLNYFEDAVKSAYKSFPSGHTGNMAVFAFAISTLFFQNKRGLQFLMLFLVLCTGFARICTGWHWPLDVLASGLIGYLLVKICLSINLSRWCPKKCV